MVAEARSWGALHDELGKETKTNPMGKAKALYSELAPSGASATGTGVLAETQRQVVEGGRALQWDQGRAQVCLMAWGSWRRAGENWGVLRDWSAGHVCSSLVGPKLEERTAIREGVN